MDILPTVVDLAGYRLEGADQYEGRSLLEYRPLWRRTLYMACWPPGECTGSVSASWSNPDGEKYIYRFGKGPEEYYDLSLDPTERDSLRDDARGKERAEQIYSETAQWFSSTVRRYEDTRGSAANE